MFKGWFKKGGKDADAILPANGLVNDWSFLGADMHSHFIPGIDDGSPNLETSIGLIRSMMDMGYNTIITTPHIMIDLYPNTPETINKGLEILNNGLRESGINLTVKAAAEYFVDEYFISRLANEPLLTITGKEVLIEFSMYSEPPMLKEVIFKMITSGYRPILAHPERYSYFHNNLDRYIDFKDRGCLMQLNLLSLSGYYGQTVKKVAEDLLSKSLYDYCGSDVHHDKHTAAIKAMIGTKAGSLLENYPFLNKKLCF